MKIRLVAASLILAAGFAQPASAQLADQRSFLHPLGFWSNNYFVAQREVYPRFRYAAPDPAMEWSSHGGWVLHERNW